MEAGKIGWEEELSLYIPFDGFWVLSHMKLLPIQIIKFSFSKMSGRHLRNPPPASMSPCMNQLPVLLFGAQLP